LWSSRLTSSPDRAGFEAALADPRSLADVSRVLDMDPLGTDEFADCEQFLCVANEAWRRATRADEADGLDEKLELRGFEPHRDAPVPLEGEPIDIDGRDGVVAVPPEPRCTLPYAGDVAAGVDRTEHPSPVPRGD
jgi:hypothetical protein